MKFTWQARPAQRRFGTMHRKATFRPSAGVALPWTPGIEVLSSLDFPWLQAWPTGSCRGHSLPRGSHQASHFRRIFIMTQVDHTRMANAIRGLAMDAVEKANSGHPGLPMGAADVATVLFTQFLKFDAAEPKWPDRDRFVLSAGHGSMLLYALLYLTGNADMTLDQIKHFRQLGFADPGASGKFPHQGHRDHHRTARPGHRDLGRHGARGEDAGGRIRQEDRRSSHLCARLRRRPDGGRLAGSDRAGRALEAQQADRAVRRQRHFDRRPDLDRRLGRPGEALQVRRLGGRTDRRPGSEGDRRRHHPRAEIQQALADRLQDHDRLRRADQGRHQQGPWRGARRR